MILRPVRPASPTGPPITNLPVGFTRKLWPPSSSSFFSSYSSAGSTGCTTCSHRSGLISVSASHAVLVLRRDQDPLDLDRAAVLVADRHLRLAVRAEIRHQVGAAHLGEPMSELVRQRDRERHELLRLARGVAEHHPLVAGAGDVELVVVGRVGARLVGLVHSLRDVGRLLVDRGDHGAAVAVEPVAPAAVADLADRLARDLRDVHVHVGRDLAGDHDEPGVHERLARHATGRILGHHGIEDAVRDLVGHLVRMALRDRLGREQELVV